MDDSTFAAFVAARGQELFRVACLLCHDRYEAEDLVQDTLAAAYVSWRRIERAGSPEAYVRRMMVNRHISLWRRHRNRVEPRAEMPDTSAVDETDAAGVRDQVGQLVRRLPTKQRAAVVLRYYVDHTDAEIADILGCSTTTVRSQISRALATLRADADARPVERTTR